MSWSSCRPDVAPRVGSSRVSVISEVVHTVLYDIPGDFERRFTVVVSYGLSMQWRGLSSSSQDVERGRE
jgi:hypothetical protein